MLELLAFQAERVRKADCHSAVIRDATTGAAVVIIRQHEDVVEVLLPDHPEFGRTLALLQAVANIKLAAPKNTEII